eukprot:97753-Pleurochrysis_carterae.AAC.1
MYDGVQMFKELQDERAHLHDAYDADEHEKEIEHMRDNTLLDICTGQGVCGKDQRPHPRPQPLHPGPLRWRETEPPHHQIPADGAGRRRLSTTARDDRQEAACRQQPCHRGDGLPGQDGARGSTSIGCLQGTEEEGQEGYRGSCDGAQNGAHGAAKGGPLNGAPYELPNGQVLQGHVPLHARQAQSRRPLLQRPTLGRTAARQSPEKTSSRSRGSRTPAKTTRRGFRLQICR